MEGAKVRIAPPVVARHTAGKPGEMNFRSLMNLHHSSLCPCDIDCDTIKACKAASASRDVQSLVTAHGASQPNSLRTPSDLSDREGVAEKD